MTPGSRLHGLRREAWQFGRGLRDALLADYARAYGEPGRPPALIGGELLTDFLGARLAYDALPLTVFAQTAWDEDRALVTVNSRMREIPGVKDAEGVAHVAIWHEIVHVQRDLPALRRGPQAAFAGMHPSAPIACSRDPRAGGLHGTELRREVFAEGAGRGAAVSWPHLRRAAGFRDFLDLATRGRASRTAGWRPLYRAAAAIGVNISALVTQLEVEGFLIVDRSGDRPVLHPQPSLGNLLLTGVSP